MSLGLSSRKIMKKIAMKIWNARVIENKTNPETVPLAYTMPLISNDVS